MKKLGILLIALFVVSVVAAPAFAQNSGTIVKVKTGPISVAAFGGVNNNGYQDNYQRGFQNSNATNDSRNYNFILVGKMGNGDPVTTHGSSVGFVANTIIVNDSSSARAQSGFLNF